MRSTRSQLALPDVLVNSNIYPHRTKGIRVIETKHSWVFLTGPYVYKVKKLVYFWFLDCTTLAKRKRVLENEFRVNRPFSPSLYLGVLPLVKKHSGLQWGGRGRVLEYALKMRQLPQQDILLQRLESAKVKEREVENVARTIATIHMRLPRERWMRRVASPALIKKRFDTYFPLLRADAVPRFVSPAFYSKLRRAAAILFQKTKPFFLQRQSRSQRIHGDFDPKNIFVVGGTRVYIFDSLDFMKEWHHGDPAIDIACFTIHFEARNKRDFADTFQQAYLSKTKDYGMLQVLPFYKLSWAIGHIWFWASLFKEQKLAIFQRRSYLYKRLCLRYLVEFDKV